MNDGDPVVLPGSVAVTFNDGSVVAEALRWSGAVGWIRGPGSYEIPGVTVSGHEVTAKVAVVAENFVVNPGFEDPDMSAWTLTGPAARAESGDAFAGRHAVTFWEGWPYATSAAQTLTGVPAGRYVLTATTQGTNSPATDVRMLSATTPEGTWSAPLTFTVWNAFDTAVVEGITVGADGVVELRADFALSGGAWGVLDEVRFIRAESLGGGQVDKTALVDVLEKAAAVDRSRYTAETLAQLDEAEAVGRVVLAGSRASAKDVQKATKGVEKALKQLREPKVKKHK